MPVSNTPKMAILYCVDYQHVTKKTIFEGSKNGHFWPKSKAYLRCKFAPFTR